MADLVAQGSDPRHRWRRTLAVDKPVVVGRDAGGWGVDWDDRVSRRHVELRWDGEQLHVRQLESARNPIFFRGQQSPSFRMLPGEHFVIGGTSFTLANEPVAVSLDVPQPAQEHTFRPDDLRRMHFRHATARIDVLGRLPELLSAGLTDTELHVRLVNLLLIGIPGAGAAALIGIQGADASGDVSVLHWDRRLGSGDGFQPSQRLILEAWRRKESVLHMWGDASADAAFTQRQGVDWAFVTPVLGSAAPSWVFYVAGRFAAVPDKNLDATDLRDDLKFTELAAATVGALREVRRLERERAGLTQFFSPVVLDALAGKDPNVVLTPRLAEVSVLFCDLRGFSRHSERSATDLLGLLNRVSRALGVTTQRIRESGGVLGDFHGDAAMGFWGWPIAEPDAAARACRTALEIQAEFAAAAATAHDPLTDFHVGIGIATGQAVAGKIGTVDQVKVTVFGPVANLASRLEGMTRTLHAPILVDLATAERARAHLSPDVARFRRAARVKPYGMDNPVDVIELLPPAAAYPAISDDDIRLYEQALERFVAGQWDEAFELLHRVPAEDRVKDFLTVLIAQHNRVAPEHWSGVIPLAGK